MIKQRLVLLFCIVMFMCCTTVVLGVDDVQYTNRDAVSFKGTAEPSTTVRIYVNGIDITSVSVDAQGGWVVRNVPMDPRRTESLVYAKAFSNDGTESPYSKKIRVIVDKIPPDVVVKVGPDKPKAGDKLKILAKVSEICSSVTAVLPDNSKINLVYNESKGYWEGVWTVSPRLPTGVYRVECIAFDRANNSGSGQSNQFSVENGSGLSVVSPEPWALLYGEKVVVQGIATALPFVEINGTQVLVKPDNTFAGEVALPKPGQNKITVVGRRENGEAQTVDMTVVRLITFPDIQTHWAKREIEFLATLGYVDAYKGGTLFYPDQTLRRDEMADIIVRAKNFPIGSFSKPTFRDMFDNHQSFAAIETGHKFGLLVGYPDKTFHPGEQLSRAEGATVIDRFVDFPITKPDQPPALDVPLDHWAAGYIYTFQTNGLMPPTWKNEMRFYPEMPINRAEFTAALARTPQMNRAIAQLINRNPEFSTVVDTMSTASVGTSVMRVAPAGEDMNARVPVAASTENEGDRNVRLLKVRVSPVEVRPGTSIMITVVGWRKLNSVQAVAPNDEVIPLKLNPQTERFEGYWKVPNVDTMYGNYTLMIKALDIKGDTYRVPSNKFAIVAIPEVMSSQMDEVPSTEDPEIMVPGSAEIVFPEYADTGESVPSGALPSGGASMAIGSDTTLDHGSVIGGSITNAQFAAYLVRVAKLSPSKKLKFVAKDVPVSHPQASAINACLARGYYKLDTQGKFNPDAPVSRAFAAVALTRVKKISVTRTRRAPYADVPSTYWAAPHIAVIKARGWMKPLTATTFGPTRPLDTAAFNFIKGKVK